MPEYLRGRHEYQEDFEDAVGHLESRLIEKVPLRHGDGMVNDFSTGEPRSLVSYDSVGEFKCIFIREDGGDQIMPVARIKRFLNEQLKVKSYTVRIYILKAVGVVPPDGSEDSEIYPKLTLNNLTPTVVNSQHKNERGNFGRNPEFYQMYEYSSVIIPGSAYLTIDLHQKSIFKDIYIGSTTVDLESRLFSPQWMSHYWKPVEKRSIWHPSRGSRGRLEMWIDILQPIDKMPSVPIYPRVQMPYELRVIVWQTKDCAIKDTATESNDLFARGCIKRAGKWMETDTHWYCRGLGSFNWRWKWEIMLPVDVNKNYGEDRFTFQLWDRDLVGNNSLIGETEINLNDHKMLSKAVFRKKPVQMKKRLKKTGEETLQMWHEVYHPEVKSNDGNQISQGRAKLSFEIVPLEYTEKLANGIGRTDPNFYPTLPEPVGRFKFDIFSPLKMFKEIIGPRRYRQLVCSMVISLILAILSAGLYYLVPTYFGSLIAKIHT